LTVQHNHTGSMDNDALCRVGTAESATINSVLPSELLVSVFDNLYRNITDQLGFPLLYAKALEHLKEHPLRDYMLVCRRWYNIIQTSPSYWTFVGIGLTRAVAPEGHDGGQGKLTEALTRLEKSGSLPIHLTVAPEFICISDPFLMIKALEKHAGRLETLNVIPSLKDGVTRPIPPECLEQLFKLPFSSLKRLYIGKLYVNSSLMNDPIRINLDAPHLDQLSYHFHIILPPTLSRLTWLSITKSHFSGIQPPIGHGQIELPNLLELRIAKCNPRFILSAFSTPVLQVLIIRSDHPYDEPPVELPDYPYLRDLQWSDVGHDATLGHVLQHAPNLTRYANYVVGKENKLDLGLMTDPPSILARAERIDSIKWPSLEEVLLDCAYCDHLLKLVNLVPTIKRIRILKDPSDFGDPIIETKLLADLKERVDVALWLDPWKDT
ncbi:hypothetical protein FRC00_006138, partial [Tulasnella sp. 408]